MRAIAIMAYDRPQYLEKVLVSLKNSLIYSKSNFDTYLFQDNTYNIYSQNQKTSDYLIAENIAIFKKNFEHGQVMLSPINLGVALNFDRAERFLFLTRNYDAAIFLEDDLVMHPYYISVLTRLLDQATESDRIGIVACYGTHHERPSHEQVAWKDNVGILSHQWGFGLTRDLYLRRRVIVDRYTNLLRAIDYSEKELRATEIRSLHNEMGFESNVTSQDMVKSMATIHLGCANINTSAVLGKNIGEVGLHSSEATYVEQGYDGTILYPDDGPMPLPLICDNDIVSILNSQKILLGYRPRTL